MAAGLESIFEALGAPAGDNPDKPLYVVMPVIGHENYLVGKDSGARACLLVATVGTTGRLQPPIRLESLDVQFELRCLLRKDGEPEREGTFTVIRCRVLDKETIRYFLSVCETILRMVGDRPTRSQLAAAVNRLTVIFQRMQRPPARPVNGLFGELFVLWRSGNPVRALLAWRQDNTARFDFSDRDVRMDVKTTGGRVRIHTFSYEQCNSPPGTIAVVASLYIEQIGGGMALRSIINEIEGRVAAYPDLVLKLYEVAAATLGASMKEALALRFDVKLAESSMRFFNLEDVPAIRGPLPAGVSDVHFRSDLSAVPPISERTLKDKDPVFWDLLPQAERT